jgi:hypothetical protein
MEIYIAIDYRVARKKKIGLSNKVFSQWNGLVDISF